MFLSCAKSIYLSNLTGNVFLHSPFRSYFRKLKIRIIRYHRIHPRYIIIIIFSHLSFSNELQRSPAFSNWRKRPSGKRGVERKICPKKRRRKLTSRWRLSWYLLMDWNKSFLHRLYRISQLPEPYNTIFILLKIFLKMIVFVIVYISAFKTVIYF